MKVPEKYYREEACNYDRTEVSEFIKVKFGKTMLTAVSVFGISLSPLYNGIQRSARRIADNFFQ